MQAGMFHFSGGETTSLPNIDTFGGYLIIFGRFFRGMLLRADSDPGGVNFYIFVPSLGLPKTTARVGSISSTAETKAVRRHGDRSLIVYSSYITPQFYTLWLPMLLWCGIPDEHSSRSSQNDKNILLDFITHSLRVNRVC